MKNFAWAILAPAICLSLAGESSGRISATVKTSGGAPIAGARILMERLNITWKKELKPTNASGTTFQVGLEPQEFNITITAEGYVPLKVRRKLPLGETLNETFVLLRPEEARVAVKADPALVPKEAGTSKESESSEAFNSAVELYNQQNYAEALPLIAKGHASLTEAIATEKDEKNKAELQARLPIIERVYGIVLVETAKDDPAKAAQIQKAEPFLVQALARNPKDLPVARSLVDAAKAKHDPEMTQKYETVMNAIIGPRPEVPYHDAVTRFNAGDFKGAKALLDKTIAMDPKYPDSYYLLGMVAYGLNNPKGAKEAFQKYLSLAPTGKKAGEVKEFLKELK